jgi:RNA polymerase sigma-70 factor, ECF subfamily
VTESSGRPERRGAGSENPVNRALADALAAERLRIVATLIRTTQDWDLAEDAVADAAERALQRWPLDGVPANPAAWLTTTARRRAIDLIRRADTERTKVAELGANEELRGSPDADSETFLDDDRLRLIFTCCHPALPMEARVALTLKVVSGLPTAAIARAFLTTEATMGQRLLRAKQKIRNAGIPYRVPTASMLSERLDGVLAVIYLVFTSAYAASAEDLAGEAIRLGRLLVELMPDSDEARGLLALMMLHHARRDARTTDGELVTLEHQDRSRWDQEAIAEALALRQLPGTTRGSYRVQADLAAVHATAEDAAGTDWAGMVSLYDELLGLVPSPVVALNRAIAIGMSDGPLAGLAALDDLGDEPKLADYHLLPAARADLLARAGLTAEAVVALDDAVALAPTGQDRRQLANRREELARDTERGDVKESEQP